MERWFLTMAAAVTAAAALMGCGGAPAPDASRAQTARAAETASLSCQAGWTYPDRRYFTGRWREAAIVAGPITLLRLASYGDADFSRPRGLHTKVVLEPHGTTTVAVAAGDRDRVSVTSHVPQRPQYAEGDASITFEGCAPRVDDSREGEEVGTGYAFTVMVAAPGCATFEITPEGGRTVRRTVGFGVQDCA